MVSVRVSVTDFRFTTALLWLCSICFVCLHLSQFTCFLARKFKSSNSSFQTYFSYFSYFLFFYNQNAFLSVLIQAMPLSAGSATRSTTTDAESTLTTSRWRWSTATRGRPKSPIWTVKPWSDITLTHHQRPTISKTHQRHEFAGKLPS